MPRPLPIPADAGRRHGDFPLEGAEVLTPAEARQRVEAAPPGASFCWYRGFLPTDRPVPANASGGSRHWSARRRRAVARLAGFMWRQAVAASPAAAARGVLWQRRISSMHYEYWFTRAKEV